MFDRGRPLVMAGLDVTHQFQATPERIAAIDALPGALAAVLADLLRFFSDNYRSRHDPGTMRGAAVHDPLAVLALTHRPLFGRVARHVTVETSGEHTRDMTVIDQRAIIARSAPNCAVLTAVDHDAAFDLLIEAIAHFSH